MKRTKTNIPKKNLFSLMILLISTQFACVSDENLITISGVAVNPSFAAGSPNRFYTGSLVNRIEGRSGNVEELVSKDAFVSAIVPDGEGRFTLQINKGVAASLYLFLKSAASEAEKILSVPIEALEQNTDLGEVYFVRHNHVNITACWQGGGNHNVQVENATSNEIWDASALEKPFGDLTINAQGQIEEAVINYNSTASSGCESITLIRETGSRYYFTLKFMDGSVDFDAVSRATLEVTSKSIRRKFNFSSATNRTFKASATPSQASTPDSHMCENGIDFGGNIWIAATFEKKSLKPVDICIENSVEQKIWPALFTDLEAYW